MAKRNPAEYDGAQMLTKSEDPRDFIKADAEKGELTGYASKFWEVDSYGEATAPGAFEKSITERGPKADRNRILFRYEHMVTVGKHTEMAEDATGLLITAYVSDDGQDGTRLRRHLKDEIQYGISIGFRRIRSRPGTPDDPFDLSRAPLWLTANGFDPQMVTVLEEVKLLEDSAVSFPAVDSALIDSYRSEKAFDAIEAMLSALKAGTLRPDQRATLERLAAELPAALAPDSPQGAPRETADSDFDAALLDLSTAIATWTYQGRPTV